ncbi:MAG: 16S rRNA (adenine(1518)-N(6)/adenine(1519)-N(6))-dimethyltransferase RsmA [Candidatus Omnitrophica bacterium]|nr:16S rRNA (adenine(1518)-N(6)/adenine(1519)-N(6))-dimethyltransferase RsmA [Candidatus Omnitrophota bacterium]
MPTQIELLKKYNLRVRGHLGQHLLLDPNIIRKTVDALELRPGEAVLEIGPGLGAVTREVLERGHPVLAVEKDARFSEVLSRELVPEYGENFTLVQGDILQGDLTALVTGWKRGSPVKVLGNLPYYISTPILFHLIDHAKVFSRAVLMLQKEVAARLLAKAGDEDYSRLSVTGLFYGEPRFLFDVSPSCFLPRPQVMSRVVSFRFRPYPGAERAGDPAKLMEILRVAFGQRRKTLLALLAHHYRTRIAREDLARTFETLGLSVRVRGEELSLDRFLDLARTLE